MNLLASLIEAEERVAQIGDRIRRQEAIILRLRQLDALPCVIGAAEELHRALTDTMLAALKRRDGFAAALEKYGDVTLDDTNPIERRRVRGRESQFISDSPS